MVDATLPAFANAVRAAAANLENVPAVNVLCILQEVLGQESPFRSPQCLLLQA